MDNVKKFEDFLDRMQGLLDNAKKQGHIIVRIEDLENAFPELAESEDERIRKQIIKGLGSCGTKYWGGFEVAKAISWLEKQCGQEPILPKWKYKNDNTPLLRDSIILNKYGCVTKSPSGALVSDVWVLDYDELAKLPKEEIEKQGEQKPAEEYNITGIGSKNAEGKLGEMIKNLKHDNEVLEQKPTDKYEGLTDFERTLADICVGWIGEELGWKQYIKDNADVLLKIAIKKFNSVQDVAFEQKPAWSEEDEAHINGIIDYLLDYKLFVYEEDMNVANGVQKELDWLKSLKQRIGV